MKNKKNVRLVESKDVDKRWKELNDNMYLAKVLITVRNIIISRSIGLVKTEIYIRKEV